MLKTLTSNLIAQFQCNACRFSVCFLLLNFGLWICTCFFRCKRRFPKWFLKPKMKNIHALHLLPGNSVLNKPIIPQKLPSSVWDLKSMHINMFFTINKMGTDQSFAKPQTCFCSVLAGRTSTTAVRYRRCFSDENVPFSQLQEFWKFISSLFNFAISSRPPFCREETGLNLTQGQSERLRPFFPALLSAHGLFWLNLCFWFGSSSADFVFVFSKKTLCRWNNDICRVLSFQFDCNNYSFPETNVSNSLHFHCFSLPKHRESWKFLLPEWHLPKSRTSNGQLTILSTA